MALILFGLLAVIVLLLYKYSVAPFDTFRDRGVAHEKPLPFIGNLSVGVLIGRTPFLKMLIGKYLRYKRDKVFGFYNMREAFFVLHDVELIKRIGIQDFDHFTNHRILMPEFCETLYCKSLIALKDDKWREMRNTLSPAFTGSKLKAMFELINECSVEGVRHIEGELFKTKCSELEMEMKDYFERFANDVIASAAFGIKVNSFVEPKNQFYRSTQSVVHFGGGWALVKIILFGIMPKVMKALGVRLFDHRKVEYFSNLIFGAMKYRKEHNIIRPDMIHLLLEAKRQFEEHRQSIPEYSATQHAEFNDEDLLAQCVLFLFVGFEIMSVCLSYLTYELCMNPAVQAKLYEEILSVEQELQGKPLSYNMLAKMKYMDVVISELLRLWPPSFSLDRVCNKDIDIYDDNKQLLAKFKRGDIIVIPIISIQRDPEYFEEPEVFKPERFLDEHKQEIKPFAYLPFGVGPRSCIGNRMALMEVKSIIYHLLLKFELQPGKKTIKNMLDSLNGFNTTPKNKFWLKLVKRERT